MSYKTAKMFYNLNIDFIPPKPTLERPPDSIHYDLLGTPYYTPPREILPSYPSLIFSQLNDKNRRQAMYLEKCLIPPDCAVEGPDELPCVYPYTGIIPHNVKGSDEKVDLYAGAKGISNFTNDYFLNCSYRNIDNFIKKAHYYMCAFGFDFTAYCNGRRCEIVEARRRNLTSTLCLQLSGVPVIQTITYGNEESLRYVFNGLAPHCPVAMENCQPPKSQKEKVIMYKAISKLIELKSPTNLIIYGFDLGFSPEVPVTYIKSRIQKFRNHDYS